MSHIRFDNGQRHVELRGSERAWMAHVCSSLALTAFHPSDWLSSPCWTRKIVPAKHYLHGSKQYERDFETWLRVSSGEMVHPATGNRIEGFGIVLNTALRMGGDEVRLMARLHGQCEIHAFIRPEDALGVAEIIHTGRRSGIYRKDMGWEAVAALLRESAVAGRTVVTSYSVTETFPGYDEETEEANDWDEEVAGLDPMLGISRDGLSAYMFGSGDTAWTLQDAAHGGRERSGT